MQLQPGIESSQKRFDALCFFQIVKERNRPGSKARRQDTGGRIFAHGFRSVLVEVNGIEPMASCLQSRRSPN